jgi:hypothetical protein
MMVSGSRALCHPFDPVSPDEVGDFSVSRDRDSLASLSAEPIRLAGTIFIYGGGEGASVPKPAN